MREDFVLRVTRLDAQGQRDFKKLAVQGLLPHLKHIARELHAQCRCALRELTILEIAQCRTHQAPHIDTMMLEESRILASPQGIDQEIRQIRARGQSATSARHGNFTALAIKKNRAVRQTRDLIEIEAHRDHKVGENQSGNSNE